MDRASSHQTSEGCLPCYVAPRRSLWNTPRPARLRWPLLARVSWFAGPTHGARVVAVRCSRAKTLRCPHL
jgi:hypothetical protein